MKYLLIICSMLFGTIVFAEESRVSEQLKVSYYDVRAEDINDLISEVKKQGPLSTNKKVWALVQWDMNTLYNYATDDKGCKIIARNVEVLAEVILPRWQNVLETSESNQRWWQQFSHFVESHEVAHFDNAVAGAAHLALLIDDMPPQADCKLAREFYLSLKHQALDYVFGKDYSLDRAARRAFMENEVLFGPLRKSSRTIVIESGIMRSYIGL